jgi:hypothetical protein
MILFQGLAPDVHGEGPNLHFSLTLCHRGESGREDQLYVKAFDHFPSVNC